MFDIKNGLLANTEGASNLSLRSWIMPYSDNHIWSKFRSPMIFAKLFWNFHPAFAEHIHSIIFFCSQKQMCWIYTRRNITFVKDTQTFWNWAIIKFPRKTVRYVLMNTPITSRSSSKPQPTSTLRNGHTQRFKIFFRKLFSAYIFSSHRRKYILFD